MNHPSPDKRPKGYLHQLTNRQIINYTRTFYNGMNPGELAEQDQVLYIQIGKRKLREKLVEKCILKPVPKTLVTPKSPRSARKLRLQRSYEEVPDTYTIHGSHDLAAFPARLPQEYQFSSKYSLDRRII